MELRRSQGLLAGGIFVLVIGGLMLLCGRPAGPEPSIPALIFGGLGLLCGAALILRGFKPFRFHIGVEGLTLRLAGINRLVRWDEIEMIVLLEQPLPNINGNRFLPALQLLLVPSSESGFDVPLTHQSPVNGRACVPLLDLDHVKGPPEQVTEALRQFGGSRFVDLRQLRQDRLGSAGFLVALRGYDRQHVDELIRRGQHALLSGRAVERHAIKAEIADAVGKLPIAMRGYAHDQVDSYLSRLAEELANWQEGEQPESEPPGHS